MRQARLWFNFFFSAISASSAVRCVRKKKGNRCRYWYCPALRLCPFRAAHDLWPFKALGPANADPSGQLAFRGLWPLEPFSACLVAFYYNYGRPAFMFSEY